MLLLIILGIILIFIGICLCNKYCCNSKEKRYKSNQSDNINYVANQGPIFKEENQLLEE